MDKRFQNHSQYMLLFGRRNQEGGKGVASKVGDRPGEGGVLAAIEKRTSWRRECSRMEVSTQVPKSTQRHLLIHDVH